MEGLIIIAVLYAWFSVIRKAAQKTKNQSNARRGSPAGARPAAKQTRQNAAQPQKPPKPSGEGMSRGYQPMQTHMEELRQQEQANRHPQSAPVYAGSLGGGSLEGAPSREGEDACDPSLGHGAPSASAADGVYAEAIDGGALGWSGRALVQGVVMSEILKRPAERKWGHI